MKRLKGISVKELQFRRVGQKLIYGRNKDPPFIDMKLMRFKTA